MNNASKNHFYKLRNLLIRNIFLIAIVSITPASMAEYLKILDPQNSTKLLVLSNYSCTLSTDIGLMEFGNSIEKEGMQYQPAGCYKMNDQENSITFYFTGSSSKAIPFRYSDISIADINTETVNNSLSFQTRKSRLSAEKFQRDQIATYASKKPDIKLPIKLDDGAKQKPQNSSTALKTQAAGKVIGMALDAKANAHIFLYDAKCQSISQAAEYPMRWDAKSVLDGISIGQGCYSSNKETGQVFMVSSAGKFISFPMSAFQNSVSIPEINPNQAIYKSGRSITEPATSR